MNLLYCLTNRNEFASPAFPVLPHHVPRAETPDTLAVREFFNLHVTTTDMYVVLAHNLLLAQPDLLVGIEQDMTTYNPRLWTPAAPQVVGAEIISRHGIPAVIVRVANEWPLISEMRLTNPLGDAKLWIGQKSWAVTVSRLGESLRVEWPAEAGISGDLVADDWDNTDVVSFQHTPIRFPFHIVMPALRSLRPALTLLEQHDLLSGFQHADNPRGVALVLAALVRATIQLPA